VPKPLLTLIQIKDSIDTRYFLQNFANMSKKYTNGKFLTTNGFLQCLNCMLLIKNMLLIDIQIPNYLEASFVPSFFKTTFLMPIITKLNHIDSIGKFTKFILS